MSSDCPRRLAAYAVVLLVLLGTAAGVAAPPVLAADPGRVVEISEPAPDWDNPRRIVLQVSTNEPAKFEGAMSNAINLQKFYGIDHVEVAIITFGGGVRHLIADSATAADRIKSLQDYGVTFVACGNTLDTIGKREADLVPGIDVVQVGIAEIVERGLRGWTTIIP